MSPDQIDFLWLVILALAAYRVTRFVVLDTLLGEYPSPEHVRGTGLRKVLDKWAYDEDGNDRSLIRGYLAKLLTCPFCFGVWASAGCVALWWSEWTWARWGLLGAAVAGGQALLNSRQDA